MLEIKQTGGAKIGRSSATWPFVTLTVNKNVLIINASILGVLYFRPTDIISIEPSSLFSGFGVQIIHRVENYNQEVIFLTWGVNNLISRIESTRFLQNTEPLPYEVEEEITKYQTSGSFPFKWQAVAAVFVIWNGFVISNVIIHFNDQDNNKIFNGVFLALAFAFLFSLTTLLSAPFRQLVLKEGRGVKDVKAFLLFLMLISVFMFLVFGFVVRM